MAKKATRKAAGGDPRRHAIETALSLAAEKGWRQLALADIAAGAGLSLAELYALFPSKGAILEAFTRDVDMAVLAEAEKPEGPAKDRVFDVLMRRLDKLDPYKPGLSRIAEDGARDPLAVACGLGRLGRSMAAMLEAAGISAGGLSGLVRVKGLSAIYLGTLRAWLRDDSPDKAKTMAALDRALSRADRMAGWSRRPEQRAAG
jgi:AcrR family transcriptional regulator